MLVRYQHEDVEGPSCDGTPERHACVPLGDLIVQTQQRNNFERRDTMQRKKKDEREGQDEEVKPALRTVWLARVETVEELAEEEVGCGDHDKGRKAFSKLAVLGVGEVLCRNLRVSHVHRRQRAHGADHAPAEPIAPQQMRVHSVVRMRRWHFSRSQFDVEEVQGN